MLKVILGHLGETIPFTLWRCDWLLQHVGGRSAFADTFREHFYLTTSGNFQQSALACCIAELGIDKILFAVDYPYNANAQGVEFVRAAPHQRRRQGEDLPSQRRSPPSPCGMMDSARSGILLRRKRAKR